VDRPHLERAHRLRLSTREILPPNREVVPSRTGQRGPESGEVKAHPPASGDPAARRFQELFVQSGVAQAVVSSEGLIVAVNDATCAMFGRAAREVVGQPIVSQIPEECRAEDERLLRDVLSGVLHQATFERRLPHPDGSCLDALVSVVGVQVDGRVSELSVCLQDITALKTAQRAAEREQARWRSLSQNASDVALIADAALVITYVSPALTALLGHDESDVLGTSLLELAHPDDEKRVAAAMHRIVVDSAREVSLEYRVRNKAGDWRYVEQHVVNLLDDPDVTGLVANLRDQTRQQELQTTLRRASLEDNLTGLPNRALVMDRVQQAIEREHSTGQRYALLFVNLDRLKAINDTYGHGAGDLVLRRVADTLCALVGPADTVGRYAGDEFAVLLDDIAETADGEVVAARVTAGLNMYVSLDDRTTVHVSACVGVAHGPAGSAEALISAAEAATYRAKELGRGRMYVLEEGMRDQVAAHRVMGAELAVAVADTQLAVHYQPIVELGSGKIAGFEALVRWPHARLGMVGPDTFLPLADALDLQAEVDEWVLHEACRAARGWSDDFPRPVWVSVNVAPAHLTSPGYAAHVRRALSASGLPAGLLVLEVTETAVVGDLEAAQQVLAALCDLGVSISIDDFGTGYSSMLQLRQLPFAKLKIDREFVRGLPQSEDDRAICASVISLADRLGVRSIAEGVENEGQATTLASLGCQLGQGYLWSPAVDEQAARTLLSGTGWAPSVVLPSRPGAGNAAQEDPEVVMRATALHESGASLHTIAASLNRDGARTRAGRRWHPASVARLLYVPEGEQHG
jgi:diguanylate cyclase (GGDEF)-like protein/PAS domain S-box-containing protein